MRFPVLVVASLLMMCACSSDGGSGPDKADLVLRNGRVVTVDSAKPEAQAIAVRGHSIIAVGTNEEIAAYVGDSTEVIDLAGRLAMPGFIEGHGHYMGVGEGKMRLDLMTVKNWDEVIGIVKGATSDVAKDAWIIGRGWHQDKWDRMPQPNVEGIPLHASLDSVSPNNPVVLTHASGHAAFVNGRALQLAGIDRNTPNPAGGEIVKDARGEPTGLLRETAAGLVNAARTRADSSRSEADRDAERRRAAELAAEESLSKGVTSFVDAGESFATVDFLKQLESENKLPVRLYVMIRARPEELEQKLPQYLMPEGENDYLTVRSIKVTIDGALGSRGAWLLEPYSDMPNSTGLATVQPSVVARTAELAIANGFQLNVHAIGDRANREVLNIYENAFKANPDKKDLRWRIEHAQHLNPADIPRFGALGVIPAMQGVHATSDGPWIATRLGEKRVKEGAYVWKSLMAGGAIIANGTDAPVEDVNPIKSFYATVTRMMNNGQVLMPEQRLTREEALRSYTINNAFATFSEKTKGSLMVGKLADIVVLSKDIMTVPEAEIPTAVADITIVGGVVKYRRQ
jgi:predicted amidohydrolase YtcJ